MKENKSKKYAVVYTDGSTGPTNPGMCGSGVHGFIYTEDMIDVKTGNKPTKFTPTTRGYLKPDELAKVEHKIVSPVSYIDWCFASDEIGTNNTAELEAVIITIRELLKLDVNSILLKADSMYALGILYKLIENQDDVKQLLDGVTKNKEYWLRILDLVKEMTEKDVEFEAIHVRAHEDNVGNEKADVLALLGRSGGQRYFHNIDMFIPSNDFSIREAKGYWKPKSDRHYLLTQRQLYFTNNSNLDSNGGRWYTLLKYDEEKEVGKPSNTASFSIVYLPVPVEKLEWLFKFYKKNTIDRVSVATLRMDELYRPNVLSLWNRFKNFIFLFNNDKRKRFEVSVLEEELIINELRPQGLAYNAIENTKLLHKVYEDYVNKNDNKSKSYIDITDLYFVKNDKGKIVFNQEIDLNTKVIDYHHEVKNKNIRIPIQFATDIMTRNNLKKLEKLEPKIILCIHNHNDVRLNYFTMIELGATKEIVVTSNFYSNAIFIDGIKLKGRKK